MCSGPPYSKVICPKLYIQYSHTHNVRRKLLRIRPETNFPATVADPPRNKFYSNCSGSAPKQILQHLKTYFHPPP